MTIDFNAEHDPDLVALISEKTRAGKLTWRSCRKN